jgi:hypothetical protein
MIQPVFIPGLNNAKCALVKKNTVLRAKGVEEEPPCLIKSSLELLFYAPKTYSAETPRDWGSVIAKRSHPLAFILHPLSLSP